MHFRATLLLLIGIVFVLNAQNNSNPFELSPRLDPADQLAEPAATPATPAAGNPFELQRSGTTTTPSKVTDDTSSNPFELTGPEKPAAEEELPSHSEGGKQPTTTEGVQDNRKADADGSLLLLTLLLLSAATLSIIFFRSTYVKAYRALSNDNLLSQLYREREAGALGIFIITYLVFFLAAGFFTVLTLRYWGYLAEKGLWSQFAYITLAISSLIIIKHFLLAVIGYVFPVAKETSRYSFTIMVFAIVTGLFLTVATAILAYTPSDYQHLVIYISLGTLVLLYLLRSFRGLFIANRFIFNYQFHFLSYICAVEIGPALCLFKYLTDF